MEGKCGLCYQKSKMLVEKDFKRLGLREKLCKQCDSDIEYLADIKKQPISLVYNHLLNSGSKVDEVGEIFQKNQENSCDSGLGNEIPEV